MNTRAISFIIVFAFSFSCKEENNTSLIVGAWGVIVYESRSSIQPDWQSVDDISCRLNQIEEYKENGSYILYDCSGGVSTGTWKLANDNTKIIYTYYGISGEYDKSVEDLGESSLIVSWDAGDLGSTQFRVAFTKQ